MPQPKDFLYSIMHRDKFVTVTNGVVSETGEYTPLKNTPEGWQDKVIKYGRNSRYYGAWRSFTPPLTFVKSAAKMLRKYFYTLGFDAELFLIIHRLDKRFGQGWVHKFFYRGELDLSNIEDTDYTVGVNIMEGDIHKLFKANENTTYEIPCNEVMVLMDGLQLKQNTSYIVSNGALPDDLGGHTLELTQIGTEAINTLGAVSQERVKTGNGIDDLWNAGERFLNTGSDDTPVTLRWKFNMLPQLAGGVGAVFGTSIILQLHVLKADNNRTLQQNLQTIGGGDASLLYNHTHVFEGSWTGSLPADCRCILYMSATQNREFTFFTYSGADSIFEIEYFYTHPDSYVYGVRPATLFQRLLDKIAPGHIFQSTYLTQKWFNLLTISGDAMRGIEGAVIKTSWAEAFDSYNVPCNLMMEIRDNKVIIEEKAKAFKPDQNIYLGYGREMKVKVATEMLFNVLKIGYPDINSEDVNGKDEFNVTHTYSTDVKRIVKTWELVSKYKASPWEQEILRINLEGKKSTNDSNDNENFFLHVEESPSSNTVPAIFHFYKLLRPVYDSITGVISPSSTWNTLISPKRCLLQHGDYLRSLLYFHQGTDLKFQSSPRNPNLKTVSGTEVIEEKADQPIGLLEEPLFIPLQISITTEIPRDIIEVMETDPNITAWFNYLGNHNQIVPIYGFPVDVGIQPANNPEMESILLCSPVTDLSKFL